MKLALFFFSGRIRCRNDVDDDDDVRMERPKTHKVLYWLKLYLSNINVLDDKSRNKNMKAKRIRFIDDVVDDDGLNLPRTAN